MRILALDSSGLVASVAIVAGADGKADAQTIGEYTCLLYTSPSPRD